MYISRFLNSGVLKNSVKGDLWKNFLQLLQKYAGFVRVAIIWHQGKLLMLYLESNLLLLQKNCRELFYMAHFVHSHTAHFYALAAPDFVVGPYCSTIKKKHTGSN